VYFEVSRSNVYMRHERGANLFTADFQVEGDRMVGYIRGAVPPVRITLTRVRPSTPAVAATAPPPASPPASTPGPAPAPAPLAPEPPKEPPSVAAAPQAPAPAEPGRPVPGEFTEIAEVKPIYFDFDKYDIRPDDATILDADAEWLKTNEEALVLIEGHCDQRGTAEYNLALGERRARATRDHLVSSGISAERISIVSLGAEHPVCTEENEACWSKNRRAAVLVRPR
jgi:peptidoglycan-associated lipoprotein